jgi:hypothetical protein
MEKATAWSKLLLVIDAFYSKGHSVADTMAFGDLNRSVSVAADKALP